MHTTVLSSKGQVIIPKTLRVERRWGPGTRLEVHDTPDGVLLRPAAPAAKVSLADGLAGIRRRLGYSGPPVSLDQMDAAVSREALRRAPSGAQPARPTERARKSRG
jgi:AbrB family looped-hinge helix DNA binding protein